MTLLVVASAIPLIIAEFNDIHEARKQSLTKTVDLLAARGDEIQSRIDTFHQGYQRAVDIIAHFPVIKEFCRIHSTADSRHIATHLLEILNTYPTYDANVRGAAILDLTGTVSVSTEKNLMGINVSYRKFVQEALQGVPVISDVFLAEYQAAHSPTIAYLAPIHGPKKELVGVAVLWVQATALWDVMKESNGKAGPGSFAALYDQQGIRIGHTYRQDLVFRPSGKIAPSTIEALVAERRFGDKTREYLEDIRAFPAHFERALSVSPDTGVFRGIAPANLKMNYGVGRRLKTVPWTVFYMIPEQSVNMSIDRLTRHKGVFAVGIILLALGVGIVFAKAILRPINALALATRSLSHGDLSARVPESGRQTNELARLGTLFNEMANQIETQSVELKKAHDELELKVQERTKKLLQTTANLEKEIGERKQTEKKLESQMARINLLNQITRAIGERQDLQSIFQVVIRTLEKEQPIDFSCICLFDPTDYVLTVTCVGVESAELALELAMTEQARVAIDENGLSRCVRGQLVYEPDIRDVKFPFPQRLANGGLCALVAAPLLVENKVFGVLIAARRQPHSFSSGECEFLKQLSDHVALASNQAQLYQALQHAYDDLHQTREAVMQQERLRSLGQMASGIAHDINNALSPISLYSDLLLMDQKLSKQTRGYMETIQQAARDVSETVGRLREFYREREPQMVLKPVDLNQLAKQVIDLSRARWHDMPQQRGVVIQVQTELAPELPAIMGVESEIREALTNLVFNAVDAMPEGGTLALRTGVLNSYPERNVRQVYMEVVDTGIGMDEDTRQHCMEPFFTTKGERGTGLGLAMVYGIVQRHSADIWFESTVGTGTTIRLIFATPSEFSAKHSENELESAPPRPMRLLVVDDDPLLIKSLRDILKLDGHEVITANGGQEGMDLFSTSHREKKFFDAVITDLGMPYVDGRRVAAHIKSLSPLTPVILLTGWGQRLIAEGDIPAHVDQVLSKPPKLRDLRVTLERLSEMKNREKI